MRQCSKLAVAVVLFILALRHAARQRTVTLLFSDERYAEMTCAAAAQVLAFGGAVELVEIGGRPNATCAYVRRALGDVRCTGAAADGGDYYATIARRLAVVVARLRSAPPDVRGYLVLDSDVALYANVGDELAAYDYDLVFQAELPVAAGGALLPAINGGVWWARARDAGVLRALRHALRLMRQLHLPDQDALQIALRAHPVRWTTLGPPFYVNGYTHLVAHRRIDAHLVRLVHANWAPSVAAKLDRLVALGVAARHPQCFVRAHAPPPHSARLAAPPDALPDDAMCELVRTLGAADAGRSARNDSLRLAAQCHTPRECRRALQLDPALRRAAERCAHTRLSIE